MKGKVFLIAACALLSSFAALAENFAQVLKPAEINEIVQKVTAQVTAEEAARIKRPVEAAQTYLDRVASLVGQVETDLDPPAARWSLVGLYGVFATHIVHYATDKYSEGRVALEASLIDEYMGLRRRCGEAPCHMNCQPCDTKCNACKK